MELEDVKVGRVYQAECVIGKPRVKVLKMTLQEGNRPIAHVKCLVPVKKSGYNACDNACDSQRMDNCQLHCGRLIAEVTNINTLGNFPKKDKEV